MDVYESTSCILLLMSIFFPVSVALFFFSYTDSASVTSLTVNGLEVNGSHLVDEGEVNLSCTFDKGNPLSSFLLMDQNGKEITVMRKEKHLNCSLIVRCKGEWPTVRCEGSGSERNKSVSLLVKCKYKTNFCKFCLKSFLL